MCSHWKYIKYWGMVALVVIACACLGFYIKARQDYFALAPAPAGLTETTATEPLSYSPILAWDKDSESVYYEIEFFAEKPMFLSTTAESDKAIFRSYAIFQNHYNAPLQTFATDFLGKQPLYWRVRGMDFDGKPYTPFSELAVLWTSGDKEGMGAPEPLTDYNNGNGSVLLYPVYHWIPMTGMVRYELQIYEGNPLTDKDAKLVDTLHTDVAELYDANPRYSNRDFYWRVRATDEKDVPTSRWSLPKRFRTAPTDRWEVGVLGDSISHGGGHYSYGPEDFEFSWLRYLNFPTINLSESGDTIQMTVKRFNRDVLPFRPKYLLILTGTNSLRGGEDPQVVIEGLKEIQQRCRKHHIRPILLTLPDVNPDNIAHVFHEPTADDWTERFHEVNAYIRTQVHIDTASAFPRPDGVLPTPFAMDGLHPDVAGKKLMGAKVNSSWEEVKKQADEEMEKYIEEKEGLN